MIENGWVLAVDRGEADPAVNHWADDRDDDLIIDFGYDADICHAALAAKLGVEDGEYDVDAMQAVFESLPESRKASSTYTQPEVLEDYIDGSTLEDSFCEWWCNRYSRE